MNERKLKSGEEVWNIGYMGDEEYLIIKIWETSPYCRFECSDECVIEGGCGNYFTNEDIVGGTVRDVYEHPERFKMRYFDGKPLEIRREG